MRAIAVAQGGLCLSKAFSGWHEHLNWRCSVGHEWNATPANVKKGTWCRQCSMAESGKKRRLDLGELREIAAARGGALLSEEYKDCFQRLKWRCGNGHDFQASASNVKRGRWCGECAVFLGERICRLHFEAYFKCPFPKARNLDWLRNTTGYFLELDGYASHLKPPLAFEHQGLQHYKDREFFTIGSIQDRDQLKRDLCRKHGVVLIEVPEIGNLTPLAEVRQTIKALCDEQMITLPTDWATMPIDLRQAYLPSESLLLEELQSFARKLGGELISDFYINSTEKLSWACSAQHPPFLASWSNVKRGRWCPRCANIRRSESRQGKPFGPIRFHVERRLQHYRALQEVAGTKGGKVLSSEYVNNHTKMEFDCGRGHPPFQATANSVKNGTWCPLCYNARRSASQRLRVERAKRTAIKNGGKCLSTDSDYKNNTSRLRFICGRGHLFDLSTDLLTRGCWCSHPTCRNERMIRSRKANQKRKAK